MLSFFLYDTNNAIIIQSLLIEVDHVKFNKMKEKYNLSIGESKKKNIHNNMALLSY